MRQTAAAMTGETKDEVIDVVRVVERLPADQRALFMAELLDHLCWRCGETLPKYDPCACGAERDR